MPSLATTEATLTSRSLPHLGDSLPGPSGPPVAGGRALSGPTRADTPGPAAETTRRDHRRSHPGCARPPRIREATPDAERHFGSGTLVRNPKRLGERRETRARNRGRRDPVGRRGQGQAHRSPRPRDGHGRALPGWPQRRPPHRGGRRDLRPPARAERDPLPPHHPGHRQRRRRRPGRAARRARRPGCRGHRHRPPGRQRQRPPDHAVPPGARPGDRALSRQERPRDHQTRHRARLRRQGDPGRPPGPGPLRPQDLPPEARRGPEGEERRPGQGVQPPAPVGRRHRRPLSRRVRPPHRADGGRHRAA